MRQALCLLICFTSIPGVSQTWSPTGATWWHNYASSNLNLNVVARTTCVGDTTILNETASLAIVELQGYDNLLQQPYSLQLGTAITRAIGDAVSYWEPGYWLPLFDLGVPIGGQYDLVVYGDVHTANVVGTGLKNVGGELLRYSTVTFDNPVLGFASDTVIERIGYKQLHICPSPALNLTGQTTALRCYEDSEIQYSALPSGTCDYTLGTPDISSSGGMVVFPNPGREGFTLLLGGEAINGTMLVLDALGRAVGSAPIRQGQSRFDAAGLAPGAYVYRALDAQAVPRATGWWVKE